MVERKTSSGKCESFSDTDSYTKIYYNMYKLSFCILKNIYCKYWGKNEGRKENEEFLDNCDASVFELWKIYIFTTILTTGSV